MKVFVKENDIPCSLEEFLQKKFKFSKRLIRKLKSIQGCLQVNGEAARSIDLLEAGDHVCIRFPKENRSEDIIPDNKPLTIIYEDDDILILYKDVGVAMSPSVHHPFGTLANRIIHYYNVHKLPYTVHFVTRLDRDTSGLVLVAKHRYVHALFNQALEKNEVTRIYEAIVCGKLERRSGIIDQPIARKYGSIIQRTIDVSGQNARTQYFVQQYFAGYSHVSVQLETGRTHQIRVHFSYIGHPLVGDTLYGGEVAEMDKQALHCTEMKFIHPLSQELLTFQSPLRDEIAQFIQMHTKNK